MQKNEANARFHRWVSKFSSANAYSTSVFDHWNLKARLLVGALVLLFGLGINEWLVFAGHGRGLGPLDPPFAMSRVLWSLIVVAMAIQTSSVCFIVGMAGLAMEKEAKSNPRPECV
jgi:hypothetical protein